MNKLFVSNAFSLNMLAPSISSKPFDLLVTPLDSPDSFFDGSEVIECMSNQATCDLFNLHCKAHQVSAEANNVSLEFGDSMLVMQYNGPRLEKGLTSLPVGGKVSFYIVEVAEPTFASE